MSKNTNTIATPNHPSDDDKNDKNKKGKKNAPSIPAELKKLNESIPSKTSKDGIENSKESNRFLGELKALASEKEKEVREIALAKLAETKKQIADRAGKEGFDSLGNKKDTLAYYVCSVLRETPMRMKEITHALKALSAKLKRPELFKTTYYDICNRLHDYGMIGKTSANEYFLFPRKKK